MDLSQLKKDAKAKLNGKFGNLLLASSLAGIILLVANILPGVGMLLVSGPITFGLEKIYHDAGQFYLFKTDSFFSTGSIMGKNVAPIEISDLEVQDIDNYEDWKIAEMKYQLMIQQ